jgi:nitroimidazol reductase NimA-like FMN-containing flavoprotein (pyridoxamine 5'-phosphate oxidase superfamily)
MTDEHAQDPRGRMHRSKRQVPDADARAFLQTQKVAHAATVDAAGRPCVVPFIYIYEGGAKGCITEG